MTQIDPRTGRFLNVNERFSKMTGYSTNELLTMSVDDLTPPEYQLQDRELMSELMTGSLTQFGLTKPYIRKDRTIFWIRVAGVVIRDAEGSAVQTASVIEDITEAREANEKLRLNEERLRIATESTGIGTWEFDREMGPTHCSERCLAAFGLPPTEKLTHERFISAIDPGDCPSVLGAICRAFDLEVSGDVACEFRVKGIEDGVDRWLASRGTVVQGREGSRARFVGTIRDITEQRRIEEELQAQTRALQESDRRKDQFLAMLAHELRNPVASITVAVQLALGPNGSQFQEWSNGAIQDQVFHLGRLLDDLLDVSRITRGIIRLKEEPLDLKECVKRTADAFHPLFFQRNVEFRISLPNERLSIKGDPTRIDQILGNLLTNAMKYTEEGEVSVSLEREGDSALLSIIDTGTGIQQDLLPQLFDVFAEGDRSPDRSKGGLGIGLALVKKLAELHGGTVSVESDGIGKGSRFFVRLPLCESALATAPSAQPGATVTPGISAGSSRILVVDDNRLTAFGTAQFLKNHGHVVDVAFDGATALTLAQTHSPGIVVLDIGLPGMTGYEIARALRNFEGTKHSLLIAVTGYGEDQARRWTLEAGFDHHFVKPIDYRVLARLVADASLSRAVA